MEPIESSKSLPIIQIEIFQPGDRGSFAIRVTDMTTQKMICGNVLPENIGDTQYLYTARLLEHGGQTVKPDEVKGDAWKKTDRYKDVVRYGQKLYTDLFGEKNELRHYMRRAAHLKGGVQYLLRMHNTASELWNIPWEYLHDGEQFMALDNNSYFVRTVPDIQLDPGIPHTAAAAYPLRILLFIADPKGAPPLNIDNEIQTIFSALQPAIEAGRVELDIVEEGTLTNLDLNLSYEPYHVLYYTGHGTMTPQGSMLVMEDEEGEVALADLNSLSQVIRKAGGLRLAVISACQSGQIDESKATSGIATGLMEVVPAVVAMQFSILENSAQVFARAFFQQIGQGETLEQAMHNARVAMNQANPALTDWGIPALYVHDLRMRMVNPLQAPDRRKLLPKIETAPLPKPPLFVGRRDEQRILRQRLRFLNFNMVYVWGMAGIGKSALAARVIERPGRKEILESALVISCDQLPPAQMLAKISDWLMGLFPETANTLRASQQTPDRRIMAAAEIVKRKRLVLVFDRFDAYLTPAEDRDHWEINNPALAAFFRVIATAPWSILTIFTSRYRWKLLNELDPARCEEIHLDHLAPREIGMLLQGLKNLIGVPMESVGELLQSIGGHPSSIYSLDKQMAADREKIVANLSRAPKVFAQSWGAAFMNDLIGRMTPIETQALLQLSVLDSVFWTDDVQFAASIPGKQEAENMIRHWEALSLVHFVYHNPDDDTVCYGMPPLVRTFMLSRCSPEQLKQLHGRAAALVERYFVVLGESRWQHGEGPEPIQGTSYERARAELRLIVELASHNVMMILIRRALSWRKHLMQIEDYEKAASIVNDVWPVIQRRYGEPDLARQLLEETVKTTTGRSQYLAQSNCASFVMQDGKFDEALKMWDSALRLALKDKDWYNAAVVVNNQASVYFRQGKPEKGVKLAEQSRDYYKKAGDIAGEASALRRVAEYYYQKDKFVEALKMLGIAEALLHDKRGKEEQIALMQVINWKGTNFECLKKYGEALDCHQTAFNMAQELGSLTMVGQSLSEAGSILMKVNRLSDAARYILDSIAIAEQLKEYGSLARRLQLLALIYSKQGNTTEALVQAERALALAKTYSPLAVESIQGTVSRLRQRR